MESSGVERRLAAIMAADVVGYSRLMEADEALTHARLKGLRQELIEPAIARHRGRAATYPHLGRMEEARAAMATFRGLEPQASIELYARTEPFKRKDDLERYLDGLRKAGLREKAPAPGT
jgi:class 3 adenylate cyclase